MKKSTLTAIMFAGYCVASLHAQQSLTSSGGNATGSGGSASYSVGQVAYTSVTGTNGSISQGVQQPFEIFMLGINDNNDISLSAVVYPNPTASSMQLKVDNQNLNNLSFQLYDITGTLILNQKVNSAETSIPMENLSTGTYFLRVTDNKIELKNFKIIKNK